MKEQTPTTIAACSNRERPRSQQQWQHIQTGIEQTPTTIVAYPDK
jgi:hypothetical protein